MLRLKEIKHKEEKEKKNKRADFQNPGTVQSTEQGTEEKATANKLPSNPCAQRRVADGLGVASEVAYASPPLVGSRIFLDFAQTTWVLPCWLLGGEDYKSTHAAREGLGHPERGGIHRPNGPASSQDDDQCEPVV